MAEAIINDLCVITPSVSPSGVLHCGLENSCKTLNEYKKENYQGCLSLRFHFLKSSFKSSSCFP